jgi:hypothetical protein
MGNQVSARFLAVVLLFRFVMKITRQLPLARVPTLNAYTSFLSASRNRWEEVALLQRIDVYSLGANGEVSRSVFFFFFLSDAIAVKTFPHHSTSQTIDLSTYHTHTGLEGQVAGSRRSHQAAPHEQA